MIEFLIWTFMLFILGAALLGAFGFVVQAWAFGLTAAGLVVLSLGG